jgi:hypothetical protein
VLRSLLIDMRRVEVMGCGWDAFLVVNKGVDLSLKFGDRQRWSHLYVESEPSMNNTLGRL